MPTFNITEFGAVGDGKTLDTVAINKAIQACCDAGGGQVHVGAGNYLTGTILMQSDVTLYLAAGAQIIGTSELDKYVTPVYQDKPSKWHRGLILLESVQDVCICGQGTINGNKVFDPEGEEHMRGPHAMCSINSRDIQVRDVHVTDAANYAMMFRACDSIDVNNVTVKGGWDGVHVRGIPDKHSQGVTVTNSRFFTGDDCIAGAYTDDILVNNCILNTACNGVRWIGPGKDMLFTNLTIFGGSRHPHRTTGRMHTLAGITIQPGAWGPMPGILDGIRIHNITMHGVGCPLWCLVKKGGSIGKIDISHITATDTRIGAVCLESWVDNPIESVAIRDCKFSYDHVPVMEASDELVVFPSFDIRPVPAWGLYVKHVRNLCLDNLRLQGPPGDSRSAVIVERIEKLYRHNVRIVESGLGSGVEFDSEIEVLRWPQPGLES
jgi:polygalacturonase